MMARACPSVSGDREEAEDIEEHDPFLLLRVVLLSTGSKRGVGGVELLDELSLCSSSSIAVCSSL